MHRWASLLLILGWLGIDAGVAAQASATNDEMAVPRNWMPLEDLCDAVAFNHESDIPVRCSVEVRATGLVGVRASWFVFGVEEELRLFLARQRGRRFRFVADVLFTVNSGGNHSSDARWVQMRAIGAEHVLVEVRTDRWFSYPDSPTESSHHSREVAVCSVSDEDAECTETIEVAGESNVRPSGYPWRALEERWWTHRLAPGQGDRLTEVRLTFDDPGLLRAEMVQTPEDDEADLARVVYYQYGPIAPEPEPLRGREAPAGMDPDYGFLDSGSFEQLCGQLATEEAHCALQRIDGTYSLLVARADDRRVVFLVRVRGDRLRLQARMIDRGAADEPLTPVAWRGTRRLPGGRVGYVFDDREAGSLRRYLLVCERRSSRCVARVPLRSLELVGLLRTGGRLQMQTVSASEAEAEIRGNVLRLRLLAGHWGSLFHDEGRAPEAEQVIEMELPSVGR